MNLYFEKETSRYIANQGVCRNSSEVLFPLHLSLALGIPKRETSRLIGARVFCSPFQYGETRTTLCCSETAGNSDRRDAKTMDDRFEESEVELIVYDMKHPPGN